MRTAIVIGLLAGCTEQVTEAEVSHGDVAQAIGGNVYDEEPQGRWLLGSIPDTLTDLAAGQDYLAARAKATNRTDEYLTVNNGRLVVRDAPNGGGTAQYGGVHPRFTNLELQSTVPTIQLRIDGAFTQTYGPVYALSYRGPTTNGLWVNYCQPGEYAVPMQGTWSAKGFHRDGGDITFGCADGGTHKCFTWTYVPGNAPTGIAWRAHQACTRMARADICGDGTRHTREETPIVIRDFITGAYNPDPFWNPGTNIEPLHFATAIPAPPDRHFFESAWSWRENEGAVCLARQRWASLAVDTSCGALRDPRTHAGAQYCEDMTFDSGSAPDILLANASRTQDMYLHRWQHEVTGDVVSTVRGWYSEDPDDVLEPFDGYSIYLGSDGILLRNPPLSIPEAVRVPVYSTGTHDRVLTTSATLTPKSPAFEGWLLLRGGGDTVPFNLYARAGDTLTSIDPHDARFKLQAPLHHVFAP